MKSPFVRGTDCTTKPSIRELEIDRQTDIRLVSVISSDASFGRKRQVTGFVRETDCKTNPSIRELEIDI